MAFAESPCNRIPRRAACAPDPFQVSPANNNDNNDNNTMKNSYSILVHTAGRAVRAYVSARRLTSAVRLVLESEKCKFHHIRSIERL